jgi:ABC-type multidrug transport system fused ATPase/permease subunit
MCSWLDTTPTSRILARATGDIQGVDDGVPQRMNWVFDISISMVVYLGAICIISPRVLVPGLLVAATGYAVGQIYVRAMLGVKRELSVRKAPVLAVFSSAISGLGGLLKSSIYVHVLIVSTVSIRAYGLEDLMRTENMLRIDSYTSVSRVFQTLDKWAGVRMDGVGTLFILGLATYLVYGPRGANPSEIGFSIDMAFGFARLILWLVIEINQTQSELSGAFRG